jgi:hypothetical protein
MVLKGIMLVHLRDYKFEGVQEMFRLSVYCRSSPRLNKAQIREAGKNIKVQNG